MASIYDADFHLEQGFETFDEWYNEWESENRLQEEEDLKREFRKYIRSFELKKCPNNQCSGSCILKINKVQKTFFWGCSQYPKCKYTCSFLTNTQTKKNVTNVIFITKQIKFTIIETFL